MLGLAIAYGDAWKNHTDALKEQAENEKLVGELVLNAALAFVPGGVGGVIGAAMKKAGSSDFMVDGIKDLTKWGLRSTGQSGLRGGISPGASSGFTAFPQDPLQWRNHVELRIKSELLRATLQVEDWQNRVNSNDPQFVPDFDPVQAVTQSLTIQGRRVASLVPVNQAEEARNFEKGFWKGWLEQYGYIKVMTAGRAGVFAGAHHNVGKKVRNRCRALGLDVEQYAAVARARVEQEAREFNARARGR
jgi:hypothetical protein